MRALVTGGAGFIGSHLARTLHENGHETLVIDSLASGHSRVSSLEGLGIRLDRTDIRQEGLGGVFTEYKPDVVFHLAAQSSVPKSVEDPLLDAKVNVVGLLRVLECARQTDARIIFASSGGTIYGEPDESMLPIREDLIGRPVSPYGISKAVAEDYLRFYRDTHGIEFVSLALANVYGPGQDPFGEGLVVTIFSTRLTRGERCVISGDGKQTRDFVFVSDVVDAFIAASAKGEGETFNIGTGIETSIDELYRKMAALAGVEGEPEYGPERPGDVRRSCLDPTKAKKVLDWEPATALDQGLALTIESFR